MGFGIHFYKQKRLEGLAKEDCRHLQAKYDELSEEISRLEDEGNNDATLEKLYDEQEKYNIEINQLIEYKDVAFFSKVYFLVRYFRYGENLSEVAVTREQIELLVKKCKMVLENNELAKDLLPTFGFGDIDDYDEYYFYSVADVLHEFENILSDTDFDTHEIIMWCWF